jgi:histidine triad (HIT) family protein
MECIFCRIAGKEIEGKVVWEDERFMAFLDINPIAPGHTLVIPKKHVDSVFDIGDPDYADLFRSARMLSRALKKALGARRVGVIIEGFLVPHAHVHLVPMNSGGQLSFSNARKASPEELERTAAAIRAQI